MNTAERLWNLRDGPPAWVYELRLGGATIAEAKPAAIWRQLLPQSRKHHSDKRFSSVTEPQDEQGT